MSERPFLLRLIIPFAIMIVVLIGVCASVIWWAGQRHVHLQQIHDLDRLVTLVRQTLPADASTITSDQSVRIKDLAVVLDARITLIDGNGVVLLDTHHDPQTMENHNTRPEVITARQQGVGSSVRHSDTINEEAVYVAQLLDPNKPAGMIVRLSYPQHVWAKLGVPIWAIVLAATAAAALLVLALAMILQQRWMGPLRELATAADRMAAGQWQTRVDPAGADEVRFLGEKFNVMASHAEKQVADLNHQRADLQALVDSLPDPILLSDALGRIVVINTPAARLLQLTPPQALGRKVEVVVNETAILRVIEQASGPSPIVREIRLQRNGQRVTYQAVANHAKAGGLLLVLRNVSAMAAAVQMKTDFVANASHELRTPIAAIKAAFETLQEVFQEDPPQTEKCVAIIDGHLKRLEEMLSDLLDLSRVESADLKAHITSVKVADLMALVRTTTGPLARQKDVELAFIAHEVSDEAAFNSDRRLLNLIIKNLVENSIKFTPAGGHVTVRLSRPDGDKKQVVLEVIDTGIGIPPEHQERVFERFYQVDHARSGAAGRGTGLGLAIVKHAVHALGGTVELSSTVNVGTTVSCLLPDQPVTDDFVSTTASPNV
ncbi:MAG TPA: ATP-binding protein [Tepidisphaeraceae bacterium]|nr:ATP-binding protein [Tepidisphaeraceae bacterium]